MIKTIRDGAPVTLNTAISPIIARYGAWAVLWAAVKRLPLAPKRRPISADTLPPYLRNDVGLPPVERPRRLPTLPPKLPPQLF